MTWGELQQMLADKAKVEVENIFLERMKKSRWQVN